MRLHSDGSTVILLTPSSRITWRKNGKWTASEFPENPEISGYDRSGLLCLTPSGERDFTARLNAAGAVAADCIDEENIAAVILGDDTSYLARGPVQTSSQSWSGLIDIGSVSPLRIDWPVGLIWKRGASLYEMAETHGNGIPPSFVPSVTNNSHGTAISSVGSGTIVVIRPDASEASFSIQVPSQEELSLYALPTAQGVLITLILDGQDSAYLHVKEDGTILGSRKAQSACPAIALYEGFLIFDAKGAGLQYVDETLKTNAELSLSFSPIDSASAPNGTSFALASDDTVARGHIDAKGQIVLLDSMAYDSGAGKKRPGEIAASEAKWDPARYHGKTAVGFAAGISPEPWVATAGDAFALKIHARSTGGAGEGISIIIGGDAVKHCEFSTVEVDGLKCDLQKDDKGNYSAQFPTVELVLGVEYPLNPKPKNDAQKHAAILLLAETHIELTLKGTANAASNDLMSVSISALGSDSPPLKWMRPLAISKQGS